MGKRTNHIRQTSAYRSAERAGKLAELLIYLYFACRGWRLVKWRYKTPFGEIDLILQRKQHMRFLEVKYRTKFKSRDNPVTPQQLQRLSRAAHFAHMKLTSPHHTSCQFDVIVLTRRGKLHHFENHVFF